MRLALIGLLLISYIAVGLLVWMFAREARPHPRGRSLSRCFVAVKTPKLLWCPDGRGYLDIGPITGQGKVPSK